MNKKRDCISRSDETINKGENALFKGKNKKIAKFLEKVTACMWGRFGRIFHGENTSYLAYPSIAFYTYGNSNREGYNMKLITTIIQPSKLDQVQDALSEIGIQGMTITEVKGFGRQYGHTEQELSQMSRIDFRPKIKVEILVSNYQTDEVIDAILNASYSGQVGDGKIYVANIEQVIRTRTGETDDEAV
ncbi:nitrogen regulatory protein PII [Mannheimia haemolytica serotype A2 str. OVINE]|nr:nitrogen regulatory protein PII [Mannheimia haemolytica serotype A2 str. OVINE]EEY12460.1 nitrogen regulatory protein PII [Mannheimia haemolytica serotype A2 str. BOVINE]